MNILVIDDDKPDDMFPAGHRRERTLANGLEAIMTAWARGEHWDQVWLDHDLGMHDGRPSTIMALVNFLEAEELEFQVRYPIDLIVICTNSPVGRENMLAALAKTSYPVEVFIP